MNQKELQNLLNSLSLEEKVGQLVQLSGEFFQGTELSVGPIEELGLKDNQIKHVGSVLNVSGAKETREIQEKHLETSKIPLLFMNDVIYGYKTILPSPLGLGATWNPNLIKDAYEMIAREAAVAGIHVTFSPMMDLVRDPRWGRVAESTGEDHYLNGEYAKAIVEGFQNDLLPTSSLASCVKHFAGYGAAEGGRDYNTVDISKWRLYGEHFPSYRKAIDAGAKMVMTSFNTIDGMPSTGNKWLMKDVLRDEWGFNGVVIADYAAVKELKDHGVAKDDKQATELAMKATVDIDMKTSCYINNLGTLVEEGVITESLLDEAVMRILNLKNELGLFEDPYRGVSEAVEKEYTLTESNFGMAKKVSDESIVLLENNGILPLSKDTKVSLVGPYINAVDITGMWAINADYASVVTLKNAFEKTFEDAITGQGVVAVDDFSIYGKLGVMLGKRFEDSFGKPDKEKIYEDAKKSMDEGDVIVLAIGEHMLGSGEGGSKVNLDLPKEHLELFRLAKSYNKPIVTIIYSGRPLMLQEIKEGSDALIFAGYPGTMGSLSLAEIIAGDVNPSGRLSMSFPEHVGQIPVYYNHFKTGRPYGNTSHSERFVSRYLDASNDPLYPFGYGLSYHISTIKEITLEGKNLSFTLENSSDVKGLETVQIYIQDVVGSKVRPVKQLVHFEKVEVDANTSKTITYTIQDEDLMMVDENLNFVVEPGEFRVFVGLDSTVDTYLSFEVKEKNDEK